MTNTSKKPTRHILLLLPFTSSNQIDCGPEFGAVPVQRHRRKVIPKAPIAPVMITAMVHLDQWNTYPRDRNATSADASTRDLHCMSVACPRTERGRSPEVREK